MITIRSSIVGDGVKLPRQRHDVFGIGLEVTADAVHQDHGLGLFEAGFGNASAAERRRFDVADRGAEHIQPQLMTILPDYSVWSRAA